jgi:glutathione synthase/RimK-type ligase-like ATP-grasp enzyme
VEGCGRTSIGWLPFHSQDNSNIAEEIRCNHRPHFARHAALQGTIVVNDQFWWTADDKFFNYSLTHKPGVAIPPTAILPHGWEHRRDCGLSKIASPVPDLAVL